MNNLLLLLVPPLFPMFGGPTLDAAFDVEVCIAIALLDDNGSGWNARQLLLVAILDERRIKDDTSNTFKNG